MCAAHGMRSFGFIIVSRSETFVGVPDVERRKRTGWRAVVARLGCMVSTHVYGEERACVACLSSAPSWCFE